MKRNLNICLLATLLLAVLLAAPIQALAIDLDFGMSIFWDEVDPYNCNVRVTLLDNQGEEVGAGFVNVPLNYNSGFTEWTVTIQNVPTTAFTARFEWDDAPDYAWDANGGDDQELDGITVRCDTPVLWEAVTFVDATASEE